MKISPINQSEKKYPPFWIGCLHSLPGMVAGAYCGWYFGCNSLPWAMLRFYPDTQWNSLIGFGVIFFLFGAIGASVGADIGGYISYAFLDYLYRRRFSR